MQFAFFEISIENRAPDTKSRTEKRLRSRHSYETVPIFISLRLDLSVALFRNSGKKIGTERNGTEFLGIPIPIPERN